MKLERLAPTEAACIELGAFLTPFHAAFAFLPLNQKKAMAQIWATVAMDVVFVARNAEGEIAGTIALCVETPYYSDEGYITTKWLDVAPGGHGTKALRVLLLGARDEADRRKMKLIVERSNHGGPVKGDFGRIAESVGYVPYGHATLMR